MSEYLEAHSNLDLNIEPAEKLSVDELIERFA